MQTKGEPSLRIDPVRVMLEEYRALKEEQRNTYGMGVQVFSFSVIVTGALLGYIIQQSIVNSTGVFLPGGIPFLIPLAILVPCFLIVGQCLRGSVAIGSYIREFIEPDLSYLRWEKALIIAREFRPRSEVDVVGIGVILIYGTLMIICLLLFLGVPIQKDQFLRVSFWIASVLSGVGILVGTSAILSSRKKYGKVWAKVKEKL